MIHNNPVLLFDFCIFYCILLLLLNCFSRVRLCATPWTAAHQAPPSMAFPRQEYWRGLPCPPPGDLPDQGIEPTSLMSPTVADGFFTIAAAAKLLQSCPTLCDPVNSSPAGSPVPGVSRQEYWSELPSPPPGDLPDQGTEPTSLMFSASAGRFLPLAPPGKHFGVLPLAYYPWS